MKIEVSLRAVAEGMLKSKHDDHFFNRIRHESSTRFVCVWIGPIGVATQRYGHLCFFVVKVIDIEILVSGSYSFKLRFIIFFFHYFSSLSLTLS